MNARERGAYGEELALEDYLRCGYTAVRRNYRVRMGEVDLIVQSPGGALVFCEVKTRAAGGAALPREAVNAAKQRRLVLAAQAYLYHMGLSEPPMRFDVVEVVLAKGGPPRINRIENAIVL